MSYSDHFKHADDIITHWKTTVPKISDDLLKTKYVGFSAIAGVTVYELAIKQILTEFAARKHKVLGNYAGSHLTRMNGKIKICDLRKDFVRKFGDIYANRFDRILKEKQRLYLIAQKRDFRNSYANMINWRNSFAHEGNTNATATFQEVVSAYEDGKQVIHCLAKTMTR